MSKVSPEQIAEADDILAASPPTVPDDGPSAVAIVEREFIKWADTTVGGKPLPTMVNAMQCIGALGLECRHDIFRERYTVNGSSLQSFVGDLSDAISRKIREQSRFRFGLDPGKESTSDAMKRICEERRFHPVQDYLNSLKWDGVPRLDKWLTTYLGVADTPLTNAQGGIIIAAAVYRAFNPGSKFDSVLVLEGPEGTYKSSVVRVLANGTRTGSEYFSDSPILNADERKQQELTAGVWFYELAELAGMRKADQFAIKAFISRQEERARPAYAEYNEVRPRTCVFIGSFNTAPGGELIEYLNAGDQRRWWPVLIGKIDIPRLERDRDQLFAEATEEYNVFGGRNLFLPADLEASAKEVAKSREKVDPLADTLSTIYRDVLRMRPPVSGGSVMLTTDGKPVTQLIGDAGRSGIMLIKGEEAEPFAIYEPGSGDVWVSSKYVGELAPPSRKSDGAGIGNAMRSLGWVAVQDRRTGDKVRGWVYTPDPSLSP